MNRNAFNSWMGFIALELSVVFCAGGFPRSAEARLLQIIHTNDLHSFLERGDSESNGGYAAIKGAIDELRQKATEQGIETLVMDGGDFSEGTQFFLSENGTQSWQIMDAMGYDAVVVGNHDWLIGPDQMDWILGKVRPKTAFLSANLEVPSDLRNMEKYVRPFVELDRAGLKIAVLGLSTDEMVYRWRVEDGTINDPVDTAKRLLSKLRRRNDFVFVVTHLGVQADLNLIKKTKGIDLVVGGHSHTALFSPLYGKDQRGFRVPIVQTGQHGDFLGDLLVDIEPGKPVKVVRYRLVPISSSGQKDEAIANQVSQARASLEKRYSAEYLYETVGFSEIPLERPIDHHTTWGDFCGETMRVAASADLYLDVGEFYGNSLPAGPITRETLIQAYPRVFDVNNTMGWNVWTIKAPGWLIELALDQTVKQGLFLNTAGITYKVVEDDGEPTVKKVRIRGKRINPLAEYKIAVSEGLGRGATEISLLLRAFMMPRDTGIPIWAALEHGVRSSDLFRSH